MITIQYAQYLLRKHGVWYLTGVASLVIAVLGLFFGLMPELRKYDQTKAEVLLTHSKLSENKISATDQDLSQTVEDEFYKTLPQYPELADKLTMMFEVAAKNEILADQVDYKLEKFDKGHFIRYHITLPVNGEYPKIRKFINQLMQKTPSLSLDQVTFGRETTEDSFVDANLDFSLYIQADRK